MPAHGSGAWSAFWQTVIRFQREKLTPWLALRNAAGVFLPLAVAIAAGQVAVGLAISTGALNVAFSDGQEPYPQRARRMFAASALVGLAVMAGELAGHNALAAIAVATAWAFAAGMMVSLSTTAADLGVISLVTLVVYAASPQPLDRAVYSGLLAISGGILETLLALAFWPIRRYAPERRALAALYLKLAEADGKPFEASLSPPASAESTDAQTAMKALDRSHAIEGERFRLLLSQAERIRLSLLMLARLRTRIGRESTDGEALRCITQFLEVGEKMLAVVGDSLLEGHPAEATPEYQAQLMAASEALRGLAPHDIPSVETMVRDARFQMDALAGQLRSAVDLAAYATAEGLVAFDRREARRPWRLRLEGPLAILGANLNLQSAAFRHATRLAVCVGIGELLGRLLSLERAYWLPMTIAIVLKPDFTATFSRGVLRLAGTFTGLLFATALFHLLPASLATQAVAIGVLMYVLRWVGPANYGIFVTAVTALVVLLIAMTGVAPGHVMLARGLNTAAGGVIALAAYALWPTWERTQVKELLARMLDAYRAYFRAIRDSYEHPRAARSPELDRTRLPGRLARSNLEASIDRLLSEPGISSDDVSRLSGVLATSHRLVHAMMALEAGLASSHPVPARSAFAPFANDVEFTLYYLAARLRGSSVVDGSLPDLREGHRRLIHSGDPLTERYALVNVETDRITNSLNTLAEQIFSLR